MWRKSSYSYSTGGCIETCSTDNSILIRDSKNTTGLILVFSPDIWSRFITDVKNS